MFDSLERYRCTFGLLVTKMDIIFAQPPLESKELMNFERNHSMTLARDIFNELLMKFGSFLSEIWVSDLDSALERRIG